MDAARQYELRKVVASHEKAAGGNPPAAFICRWFEGPYAFKGFYAFIAALTKSAVIGSERTRAPEALKIAFASAGAITVTAGSPTPVACSPLAMTLMATSGV